jgi:hypothetical protein
VVSQILPDSVRAMLEAVPAIDADGWAAAFATRASSLKTGYVDARKKPKASASLSSALRKATLEALGDRIALLKSVDDRGLTLASSIVDAAGLAMIARSSVDDAEFELIVAPLVAAGIPRPTFEASA